MRLCYEPLENEKSVGVKMCLELVCKMAYGGLNIYRMDKQVKTLKAPFCIITNVKNQDREYSLLPGLATDNIHKSIFSATLEKSY